MAVNPDVDNCKTLNHQQILRKSQKNTENQRILKLKYKPSGGPSFTFTVAYSRGRFAPPAAAGRPKHRKNFHWLFARSGKNFGDIFLWQEVLRCAIKKYFFHCYILLGFNPVWNLWQAHARFFFLTFSVT